MYSGRFPKFDPYEWLIQIENRQNDLEHKHNQAVNNFKQMAVAYNDLGKKYNDLKNKVERFETDLWKAKSNDELIAKFYKLMGRPER